MGKKITVQVAGGKTQTLDLASTVGDAKRQLGLPNHTALVNDSPAKDGDPLPDFAYVALAENVKGAA